MPDVLDQSEVDALLAAVDTGQIGGGAPAPAQEKQVAVYDFKRPERVSKEQLRAITALHESFARNFGAALSSFMRTIVDVELSSVEQLTYSQFILSLPNPTCFALLSPGPLDGSFILEINPSIVFPIIDRLLGGGKSAPTLPNRPLTNIEFRLATKILNLAIEHLADMWRHVMAAAAFRITETESNPQLVQIVPPNEPVVLVTFQLSMGEISGTMSLCLPYGVIEPILGDLTKRDWFSYRSKQGTPKMRTLVERGLKRAPIDVQALLARATITVKELMALAPGDIIKTESKADGDSSLMVNGKLKFRGKPAQLRGKRAFLVSRAVNPDEDL